MPWLRFTAPFDWSPAAKGGRVTIAYKAGTVALVTRECADAAKAAGKAASTSAPRKGTTDGEGRG